MCHHVGTWSPQSPWRREHCSALGTWGVLLLLLPQPLPWAHLGSLAHLINQLFTSSPSSSLSVSSLLLHLESHSLLLNKVHSNLKLPLLTLTTNGSFLFLVLLSSLNLSLSDSSSEYTSSASDSSILDHPSKSACILSLFLLHCLIHPQPFSL
ncbi:unnamed protein product [Microthlaspi erraticum]|uniref:Uncharacterized protein n=1 Tax=Microthlaspi erraticum TaxID=1685480 RepID=A0A6D2IUF0_9BRAS|nr:unnamed protein product [Microthlaspi erraticum]